MAIRRDRPAALRVLDAARAIRVMADALGRESRRELVELVVDAWVEAIPEHELADNYAKALAGLRPDDLREVAGWPGSAGTAVALANPAFSPTRAALRCAALQFFAPSRPSTPASARRRCSTRCSHACRRRVCARSLTSAAGCISPTGSAARTSSATTRRSALGRRARAFQAVRELRAFDHSALCSRFPA
jgi:hypothetical protein